MNGTSTLDWSRCAIVVIDMQNDFCHPGGAAALNGMDVAPRLAIVPAIQRLIDEAHRTGTPVIFVKTTHDESTDSEVWLTRRREFRHPNCRTGSWGAEYFGVAPAEGDIEVVKHRYSAFIHTDLELKLKAMGCQNLVLTGVATNTCVESTMRDGFMLDFHVVLATDCTVARSQHLYDATLENMSHSFGWLADSDEISSRLRSATQS